MAIDPNVSPSTSLIDRVKNILMQPRAEWPRIDAEPATIGGIYRNYVLILAAIPPVCLLIGMLLFGVPFVHFSMGFLVGQALLTYVLSLVSVYVLALIIDALAPSFGGTKDPVKAFKVAAYSSTAAWVVGIFSLVPLLGILGILGLYSLYLLYLGLPVLMKVNPDKSLGYTIVTILAAIVLWVVVGAIASRVMMAVMPAPTTGTVTFTLPS